MNVRNLLVAAATALSALVLAIGSAQAQGFAGLGTDGGGGFAQVVRGKPLVFPADHGAHPDHRIEWWYLTANLRDAQGTSYGVQWTLFRQAMSPAGGEGWADQQLWMGHAAVTTATRLRQSISDLSVGDGVRVTASIGVAHSAQSNAPLDALLERADVALYEAKSAGRNTVRALAAFAANSDDAVA